MKSGNDTEFRESICLLGGRVYPIRLEFSKGKQGEKDGKKDPDPPPTKATVALLWKPPGQPSTSSPSAPLAGEDSAGPGPPDGVSARRPERRLRARNVGLESLGPGDHRCGPRGCRLRRGPPGRAGRRPRRCGRPRRQGSRILPQVCRAGVPPAAVRRAEGVLRRSPVQGRQEPGRGGQARRLAGPQVAPVSLPRG